MSVPSTFHFPPTLAAYFRYYHRSPHLAFNKQCPIEHQIMTHGAIVEIAELDGLHHRDQPLRHEMTSDGLLANDRQWSAFRNNHLWVLRADPIASG